MAFPIRNTWIFFITLAGLLFFTAAPLRAHKVSVFAWVEGDSVFTQSRFSGGKKPKNAPVAVYDLDGRLLLEGRTDDQGEFSFPIPQRSSLRIVLSGGTGHLGEWIVPADEIFAAVEGEATVPAHTHGDLPESAPAHAGGTAVDQEQLLRAVEEVIDRKLKPVMQMLSAQQQGGPSLSEILGGIGYIIGLVGLGAYMQARKSGKRG